MPEGFFNVTGSVGQAAVQAQATGAPVVEQRSWGSTGMGAMLSGMRSGAPGGWSDNRYEQARHFTGIAYTAIRARADVLASAEAHITMPHEVRREKNQGPRLRKSAGTSAPQHAEGRVAVGADHPLAALLEDPNPQDTKEDLFYEIELQRCLTSKALLWQVPNDFKLPRELYVIPTPLAMPMPRSAQYPSGAWRITPLSAQGPFASLPGMVSSGAVIPAEQITQLGFKHPLYRFDHYAPLTAGAIQMDILEQVDRSRWSAMAQGVTPSSTLKVDPIKGADIKQADLARLQARFDEKYAGSGNFGKLTVLPPGTELAPYSSTPAEMAFGEGWTQMAEFVLALFGVPKAVIGWMENYSYAGLYAAIKAFLLLTMRPEARHLSAHLTKFLGWQFDRRLKVSLELPAMDDPQLLEVQLANDLRARSRTRDEWRALRHLPPVGPERGGDEFVGSVSERITGNKDSELPADNLAGGGALGGKSVLDLMGSRNGVH